MRPFATLMTTLAFTVSGMTFSPAQATVPVDGSYNCSTGLASPGPFLTISSGAVVDGGDCTGAVVIPDGVTSIGSYAFFFSSLTSIDIPSSVTTIAGNAFRITKSLTSVTVDGANSNFSSSAGVLFNKLSTTLLTYPSAKSGTSYSIPSSVTSIGDYAFDFAVSPTSIDIPSSVTSIGSYAFSRTSSLTSIDIPSSVTSIGMGAFFNATSLNSINIPASVTSLGSNVFEGATALNTVTFESGSPLTSIGNYAFFITTALTSVTIPLGVTSIGNYAFYGGASLSSVYFLGNAPTVGSSAFADVAAGAKAYIKTGATGFADVGQTWNGLTVTIWTESTTSPVPIIANAYRADKLGTVYFAPLSSKLSKDAKKKLGAAVIANPSAIYKVTGYVQKSIIAKNAKNDSSLSLARAEAVETYLVSLGAGVTFTVVDAGKVPAKNGKSSKARRATLYAMTPVVQ
ncbi:MAG: leucine-rich repeat protein [Actinomycetes bacterium]